MNTLLQSLLTLISGGILWQGIKFFYPDIKQKFNSYAQAKKSFYESIDPILKSADELYGKIYSLSKEDFATFINQTHSYSEDVEHNKKYILYLFAQFWAQLEFIRLKSQYTSLTQFKKGEELLNFIETIESRAFRILDRSLQRVIGETLIEGASASFKVMSLNQFIRNCEIADSETHKWAQKLEAKLNECSDKKIRQRILVFGAIILMLIDHFDPSHKIIHPNKIYNNKLNETSKKLIKRNLLQHYLKFIKNKSNYYS